MPDLNAKTLTQPALTASELYEKLIYGPEHAAPHETFEVLNGNLDGANLKVGEELPAWSWQYGAFAQGKWYGFDQHEFVYARQLGGGGKQGQEISERAVLAQRAVVHLGLVDFAHLVRGQRVPAAQPLQRGAAWVGQGDLAAVRGRVGQRGRGQLLHHGGGEASL